MANILMKGFDVSASNTNVDFKKAKEQGYDFVIIRAGFGRYEKQKDTVGGLYNARANTGI